MSGPRSLPGREYQSDSSQVPSGGGYPRSSHLGEGGSPDPGRGVPSGRWEVPPAQPERDWGILPPPPPPRPGQAVLGQVLPPAVRLLWFPAGGLLFNTYFQNAEWLKTQCKNLSFPFLLPEVPFMRPPGGPLLHVLSGHTDEVNSVDLSKDSRLAVTCEYTGLWNTTHCPFILVLVVAPLVGSGCSHVHGNSGQHLHPTQGTCTIVHGRCIEAAMNEGYSFRFGRRIHGLWDVREGRYEYFFQTDCFLSQCISFCCDDQYVVVSALDSLCMFRSV